MLLKHVGQGTSQVASAYSSTPSTNAMSLWPCMEFLTLLTLVLVTTSFVVSLEESESVLPLPKPPSAERHCKRGTTLPEVLTPPTPSSSARPFAWKLRSTVPLPVLLFIRHLRLPTTFSTRYLCFTRVGRFSLERPRTRRLSSSTWVSTALTDKPTLIS